MKIVLVLIVAALFVLSVYTQGLISALAELAAFIAVIAWVLKTKSAPKSATGVKSESSIEPHV